MCNELHFQSWNWNLLFKKDAEICIFLKLCIFLIQKMNISFFMGQDETGNCNMKPFFVIMMLLPYLTYRFVGEIYGTTFIWNRLKATRFHLLERKLNRLNVYIGMMKLFRLLQSWGGWENLVHLLLELWETPSVHS